MTDSPAALPVVGEAEWEALRLAAVAARERAYAPYSNFKVGAAALTEDGRTVSGCNVENAAYGVTLCAECNMVGELFATGGGKLHAFYCVDATGTSLMPCGRCRQLLHEHSGERMQLMTPRGIQTMDQVLPDAFGPHNL
jgi:cytidine deaminase